MTGAACASPIVQLPALNTPQFSVVRTRLPRHPQPVPPIFQPEVAARAVVHAAERPRRELWVGGSTVKALLATKVAPGLGDRYLARTGYDAQQADLPLDPARLDNLDDPLPGDRGAHGIFDSRSKPRSLQFEASRRRGSPALLALALAALARRLRG